MHFTIRKLDKGESGILETFLYEAIFIPEGEAPPPKTIVNKPELQIYIENFGDRKDDFSLVAETEGTIIGAIWARIMNDYGHIDNDTPSLAISVCKEYRNLGIGTALLKEMLRHLRSQDYRRVSLSVQKVNAAVRLYQRAGFEIIEENDEEYKMACKL